MTNNETVMREGISVLLKSSRTYFDAFNEMHTSGANTCRSVLSTVKSILDFAETVADPKGQEDLIRLCGQLQRDLLPLANAGMETASRVDTACDNMADFYEQNHEVLDTIR
jgi:hypothetical protein